jgi:error-prone DNA polymerase
VTEIVRGLANKDGAEIVASRADDSFSSIDDLWRRADVPVASLVQLAEADAMNESGSAGSPLGAEGAPR